MHVTRIGLRDFRNYESADVDLAEGLTVVAGANGAGKTNLLEALYFGCTGRSPRTSNERELVRRGGEGVARVVLDLVADDGEHRIEVGFEPGEAKHLRVDGSAVDSLSTVAVRTVRGEAAVEVGLAALRQLGSEALGIAGRRARAVA